MTLIAIGVLAGIGGAVGGEEGDSSPTTVVEAVASTEATTTTEYVSPPTAAPPASTTTTSTTTTVPPTTTTTVFDPMLYQELPERDYALFVRMADDHIGEQVIVYGRVWQFDNATGPDTFLAETSSVQQEDWFDYEHDAFFTGEAGMLSGVVEDDIVKVYATGLGSLTYDTAIGGSNTVPVFSIDVIEVVGFAD